jgi:hypothetical protein
MSGFRQSGGSLEVTEGGLSIPLYDAVDNTGATGTTDLFIFKIGGLSGLEVCRVLIQYTDSTKSQISTVLRTIP